MAAIDPIYNGESGAAVRAKLNALIDTVNSGSQTVNVGDAPLYDPDKVGGYAAGSIVSYKNEDSPDPEFQEFAIYVALADIVQGVSPEDSDDWKNEGASIVVAGGNTANGMVQNITRLRELTGMRTGNSVIVRSEGAMYFFDESTESFVKPFAPGIGSWRKISNVSLSNIAKVFTDYDAAEGNEVMCPLFHTIINFAQEGTVTLLDDSGNAALSIVFDGPCIVRRIAQPLVLASFEVTPLDISGGHIFEDSSNTALPTRSVAKAGDGIEFEDDAVNEMTVVRVSENTMEAIRTKTYSIDFGSNSYAASEINMLGDIVITDIAANNVDSILLSYSGGIQQPVFLGAVNIAVPASDVLFWEITRQAADMPAVLGVKFEII